MGVGGLKLAKEKDEVKSMRSENKKKSKLARDSELGYPGMNTEEDGRVGRNSKTVISEQSEEMVCRICLGTEAEGKAAVEASGEDLVNPLISPCKCAGTMGMIHLVCLRNWLETKRTKKVHRNQITLKFSKLDCELCKTCFPFKIAYKNQIVDIVGVEKPEKDFIILENLSNENQKVFHIINTKELTPVSGTRVTGKHYIKIGRGADSDVRVVEDISISRNHAFIHKTANGSYVLPTTTPNSGRWFRSSIRFSSQTACLKVQS